MARESLLECVKNGTTDEIVEILDRLRYLPEFGQNDFVTHLTRNLVQADGNVDKAQVALAKAKEHAADFIESLKEWTPEEICEATGY